MNFFKKLFSSKKNEEESDSESNNAAPGVSGVFTKEYFDNRYTEDAIDPVVLDGCFKMIEGYFLANKIQRLVQSPINYPSNLDQLDREGFGFVLYCKAFQIVEEEATLFIAYSFSDYLINKYGFKLYKDSEPEYPLRGMTLKYDQNDVVLSLYPFEYTSKVLNENSTFTDLEEKISSHLAELPKKDDILNTILNAEKDN